MLVSSLSFFSHQCIEGECIPYLKYYIHHRLVEVSDCVYMVGVVHWLSPQHGRLASFDICSICFFSHSHWIQRERTKLQNTLQLNLIDFCVLSTEILKNNSNNGIKKWNIQVKLQNKLKNKYFSSIFSSVHNLNGYISSTATSDFIIVRKKS